VIVFELGCGVPAYAPELNPVDVWSLLKRSIANVAAADLDGLARIVTCKLNKIQYRPHLIDGCLAAAGLRIEPLLSRLLLSIY
jgi:hypothetical protein